MVDIGTLKNLLDRSELMVIYLKLMTSFYQVLYKAYGKVIFETRDFHFVGY